MRFLLAGILLLCSCPPTAAAEGRKPAAAAVSTVIATDLPPSAAAIQIDGELSEAVWATVPPVSGFVQRDPTEGAPATFDTEVRVAFDDTALYVAVHVGFGAMRISPRINEVTTGSISET